ncbi:MAG: TRAM domain-containing protein [Chloroflexi bacterium CFX6]|nr:TRAM domain-containing protein [Chloroflexi bacterium CFX6]
MPRRWKRIVRLIGAISLAIVGYSAGSALWPEVEGQFSLESVQAVTVVRILVSLSFALFGFAFGYVLTPLLLRPLELAHEELAHVPPVRLVGTATGLAFGLLLGALAALPLSFLHDPLGQFLPFIVALVLAYLGAATVGSSPGVYLGLLRNVLGPHQEGEAASSDYILLDTSVIIDGRVADLAETGFIDKTLLVPRFVLDELQQVADSADSLRRNRGRRGLEILNRIQQSTKVNLEISDRDFPHINEVDRKLVHLAEQLNAAIMTNDYNLNRVAEIQGIRVLNLNELVNAVKTLLLPGEHLTVRIIQEGKEFGQGVAYLEDGTMVVVEEGRAHIDDIVPVTVTRVLQTVAGRMMFASLADAAGVQGVGDDRPPTHIAHPSAVLRRR